MDLTTPFLPDFAIKIESIDGKNPTVDLVKLVMESLDSAGYKYILNTSKSSFFIRKK